MRCKLTYLKQNIDENKAKKTIIKIILVMTLFVGHDCPHEVCGRSLILHPAIVTVNYSHSALITAIFR
jgi:hypothetical protein